MPASSGAQPAGCYVRARGRGGLRLLTGVLAACRFLDRFCLTPLATVWLRPSDGDLFSPGPSRSGGKFWAGGEERIERRADGCPGRGEDGQAEPFHRRWRRAGLAVHGCLHAAREGGVGLCLRLVPCADVGLGPRVEGGDIARPDRSPASAHTA